MLIVRDALPGVRRYEDLVERLGISRATLADRIRRLTEAGIVEPSEYLDRRGRQRLEYRLTERGIDLRFVLIALREWGDTHLLGEGNAPVRLIDRTTGHGLHLGLIDDETGEVVDPARARSAPGPGFSIDPSADPPGEAAS
jgi:DNA-binding HxlR family transcriptional regulator